MSEDHNQTTSTEKPQRPNPEKSVHQVLQVDIPDDASSEYRETAEDANAMLLGFGIIGNFVDSFRNDPLQSNELSDNPDRFRRISILAGHATSVQEFTIGDIIQSIDNLQSLSEITGENLDLDNKKIKQVLDTTLLPHHKKGQIWREKNRQIAVAQLKQVIRQQIKQLAQQTGLGQNSTQTLSPNIGELFLLQQKFSKITHDLRNPLASIAGNALTPDAAFKQSGEDKQAVLQEEILSYVQGYDTLHAYLTDTYEKTPISVGSINKLISSRLPSYLASSTVGKIYPEYEIADTLKNTTIEWSEGWIELLLKNIAQNTINSFTRLHELGIQRPKGNQLKVTFKKSHLDENPSQEYLAIIFEDNGVGIQSHDILDAHAFLQNVTNWGPSAKIKGHGIGMAYHAGVITNIYGGRLTPENITEDKNVVGARITLLLPIANETP